MTAPRGAAVRQPEPTPRTLPEDQASAVAPIPGPVIALPFRRCLFTARAAVVTGTVSCGPVRTRRPRRKV